MVASAPNHYHAIKSLFQYLVDSGPLTSNPAASVNYTFVRSRKGKTVVITKADVRALLVSIPSEPDDEVEPARQTDLRDRALIALMAYTFARIGGALLTNVGDYKMDDGVMWLDMIEKGSKAHTVPISGAAREYLDTYISQCGLTDPKAPLFQSANRNGQLTGKRYDRGNSRRMIARRAEALGIGKGVKNHTFRATGITRFWKTAANSMMLKILLIIRIAQPWTCFIKVESVSCNLGDTYDRSTTDIHQRVSA